MISSNKRKIMSYPFTGLDYSNIKEIGDRVYIDGDDLLYFTSSIDKKYNMKSVNSVVVEDESVKCILFYFSFLNDLCRKYFNSSSTRYDSDISLPSFNTYIDTVLISINEVISICKCNNCRFNFSDFFNCSLSEECLSKLFDFLMDDSYISFPSKCCDNGVVFDKLIDGNLNFLIYDVIKNKDAILCVNSSSVNKRVLLKKVYRNKAI